ncbi:MAG: hypothetical protein WC955_04030 [Elusimicrobiota bacterium]
MGVSKKVWVIGIAAALMLAAVPIWAISGTDYENYGSSDYKGYPRKGTDIYDWYDYFGEKMLTGYNIYEFINLGSDAANADSYLYKSYRYNRWLQELIMVADEFEGMKHRVIIGDEIRTKFGSFMLDKAGFSGIRWDMNSKFNDWSIITSRLSNPILVPNDAWNDPIYQANEDEPVYLLGIYDELKLFGQKFGLGYVNCHVDNNILGESTIYGTGTGTTGLGIMGFALYGNLRGLNYRTEYNSSGEYVSGKPSDKTYPAYQAKADTQLGKFKVSGSYYYVDPGYTTQLNLAQSKIKTPINGFTNSYNLVDDNDDNDQYPDELDQMSYSQYLSNKVYFFNYLDGVFPGLDKNKNGISDYNENRNAIPDYEEDFLRFSVDSPDFEFGDDFNNNGIIDYFENDQKPDYDYARDRMGMRLITDYAPSKNMTIRLGGVVENMPSNPEKRADSVYSTLIYNTRVPNIMDVQLKYYIKRVQDAIPDDTVQYSVKYNKNVRETVYTVLSDKLSERDSLVNTLFLDVNYNRFKNLEFETKLKYESNLQDMSSSVQRQSNFTGVINRLSYTTPLLFNRITLTPMLKTQYELYFGDSVKHVTQNALIFRADYKMTNKTRCVAGMQFLPYRDYVDKQDYDKTTYLFEVVSQVLYLKYQLAMIAGVKREDYQWLTPDGVRDVRDYIFLTVYMGG